MVDWVDVQISPKIIQNVCAVCYRCESDLGIDVGADSDGDLTVTVHPCETCLAEAAKEPTDA